MSTQESKRIRLASGMASTIINKNEEVWGISISPVRRGKLIFKHGRPFTLRQCVSFTSPLRVGARMQKAIGPNHQLHLILTFWLMFTYPQRLACNYIRSGYVLFSGLTELPLNCLPACRLLVYILRITSLFLIAYCLDSLIADTSKH